MLLASHLNPTHARFYTPQPAALVFNFLTRVSYFRLPSWAPVTPACPLKLLSNMPLLPRHENPPREDEHDFEYRVPLIDSSWNRSQVSIDLQDVELSTIRERSTYTSHQPNVNVHRHVGFWRMLLLTCGLFGYAIPAFHFKHGGFLCTVRGLIVLVCNLFGLY